MPVNPRMGRPRRRACAQVLTEETHCHLCGMEPWPNVDRQRHPLAPTVDELIPVLYGGSTTERTNLRLACRCCNTSRGASPLTPEIYARCQALSLRHRQTQPALTRTW